MRLLQFFIPISILLVVSISQVSSKTGRPDSLLTVLSKTSDDISRSKLYLSVGKEFQSENPDSALYYFNKSVIISHKYPNDPLWDDLQSQVFRELGNTYNLLGNAYNADSCFNWALKLNRKLGNDAGLAENLNSIGINKFNEGDFKQSMERLFEALAIFEKIGDKKNEANSLKRIGLLFLRTNDYDKSIEYSKKGLHIYAQINDKLGISQCYNNLGIIFYEKSQLNNKKLEKGLLDSALFNQTKSFEINKELGIKSELARSYTNISNIYSLLGKVVESLEYSQHALAIYEEMGDKRRLIIGYVNMAGANITLADSTYGNLLQRNVYLTQALEYEQNALILSKELQMNFETCGITEHLKNIYKRMGQYDKALEYAELFVQYKDSLLNEEKIKATTEMSTKYETEKKEQQLKIQELQIQKEKVFRYFLIIGLVLTGAFAYYVFRNYKRKQRDNRLLKAQKNEIVSQAKQLEIQNLKLLELDQFKQGMTGMIVHDLKNPLNTIINATDKNTEKVIQRTKQAGRQMLNMILNILDVSKYENSRMIIEKMEFPVYQLSQKAMDEVIFLAERKNIIIENNILPSIRVIGDSGIIERIFINLLSNAIKFSPENGQIEINGQTDEQQGQIIISVNDTGQGISKEYHDKIFDKFTQIEAKESGEVRSTGLGLAFCKIATEAHNGKIWVNESNSAGTSISFTLPTCPAIEDGQREKVADKILIALSEREKLSLQQYLPNFEKLEIYEISAFRKLFLKIENEGQVNPAWLQQLKNSVDCANKREFENLINEVKI